VTLLVYDVIVVAILRLARFAMRLSGIGLWPGIVLHTGLGVWSLLYLMGKACVPVNSSNLPY